MPMPLCVQTPVPHIILQAVCMQAAYNTHPVLLGALMQQRNLGLPTLQGTGMYNTGQCDLFADKGTCMAVL